MRSNRLRGIVWLWAAIILGSSRTSVAQTVDLSGLESEIALAVERMMIEGHVPSATIALISGDRVVWSGGFGSSNLWARTPAVPSTVYLIGSTFKAMSTVALLQQMEQGRFDLDDRVSDYLSDLRIRGEDAGQPITFRHLLTHTSGLPPAFGAYLVWSDSVPPPLREYLARDLEVVSPPLDSVRHSNLAFSLVAHLVEKFSGQPYREYMQQHIFEPLRMETAFDPTPHMAERLAVPYVFDQATGSQVPTPRLKASVWPAGIVYGTVLDQANWLIANLNGGAFQGRQIISEATLEQMHTRQWDQFAGPMEEIGFGNATTGYGLTWWTTVHKGDRYFAHSGSVPGYTAFLLGNRDRALGVAILTNGNRAHPHLVRLAHAAIDALMANTDTRDGRVSGRHDRE